MIRAAMPRLRSTTVPLALAAAMLALSGCTGNTGTAKNTVRDFLSVTLVEQNGQKSCDRMTTQAQGRVAAAGNPGSACRENMERARLALGGTRYSGGDQVIRDLEYEARESDEQATVTVTGARNQKVTFQLAYQPDVVGLYPVDTPWRVAGGVEQLLQGPTAR